jgi:hypothetical protein
MLGRRTPAALVLGLDLLSPSATPTEIDSHLDLDLGTLRQRLLFGHTRTEVRRHSWRILCTTGLKAICSDRV